jgi:hypothetical protein
MLPLERTSYSPSRSKTEHTMPEKGEKIWRKRKNDTRPKTPMQPKHAIPAPDENKNERLRCQLPEKSPKLKRPEKNKWRKTISGPQPQTPVDVVANLSSIRCAALDEEVEDDRSDLPSETSACTPHRRSAPRPALSRYLSEYLSFTTKEQPIFSQPWNDEFPAAFFTPVSLISTQSSLSLVRSLLSTSHTVSPYVAWATTVKLSRPN